MRQIYSKLQDTNLRLTEEGYSPHLYLATQDIADDAKKDVLCGHSEKLAVTCAPINTPLGKEMAICPLLKGMGGH